MTENFDDDNTFTHMEISNDNIWQKSIGTILQQLTCKNVNLIYWTVFEYFAVKFNSNKAIFLGE